MNGIPFKVEREISEVLGGLRSPVAKGFEQFIVIKVMRIHNSVHTNSKFFRVKKLVPLVIYVFLTLLGFSVSKSDLARVSAIFYEELNCFFRQLRNYLIKYHQCGNYV